MPPVAVVDPPKSKTPKIDALYQGLSESYDLGTVEEFREKVKDPAKRKVLYESVSEDFDLGDFKTYEQKITSEITPPTGFWGNVKDAVVFSGKGLWATVTKQIPSEFRTEDLRLSEGVMGDMFDPRSNISATKFTSKVITPEMKDEFRQFNNSQAVRALGLSKKGKVDKFLKMKFGSGYDAKKKEFEKEVIDYRVNIEKEVAQYQKEYGESMEGTPGDISDVTSDNVGKFIGNLVGQGLGRIPASVATGGSASFMAERAAVFNNQLDKLQEKTGLSREEIIKQGLDEPETGRMLADFLGALDVVSAGGVTGIVEAPFKKKLIRKALSIGGEVVQETVQGEGEEIGGSMGADVPYSPDASRMLTNAAGGLVGSGAVMAGGAGVSKATDLATGKKKPVNPSDLLAPAEKQEAKPGKVLIVNDDEGDPRETNTFVHEDGTVFSTYDTGLTVKGTNKPISLRSQKSPNGKTVFSGEGIAPFEAESVEKAIDHIKQDSEAEWKKTPVVTGTIKIEQVSQDQYGTMYNSGLTNKETGEPIRIIKREDPVNPTSFESENGTIKGTSVEDVAAKIQAAGIPHVPAGGDIKANAIIAADGVTEESITKIYDAWGYTKEQAKQLAPEVMGAVNVRVKEKNVSPEQAFYEVAAMRKTAKDGGSVKDVKAAGDDVKLNKLVKQPETEAKLAEAKKEKGTGKKKTKKPVAETKTAPAKPAVVEKKAEPAPVVEVKEKPVTKTLTPQMVHAAAEEAKIDYNAEVFKDVSEKITGKRHLDDMDQAELGKVRDFLNAYKEEKSKPKPDAIQKPEAKSVPVQPAPANRKKVGEKVRVAEKPAASSPQKAEQVAKPDVNTLPASQRGGVRRNTEGGGKVVGIKKFGPTVHPVVEVKGKDGKTVFITHKGDAFYNVDTAVKKSLVEQGKPKKKKAPAKKAEPTPQPVAEKKAEAPKAPVAEAPKVTPIAEAPKVAPSPESLDIIDALSHDIFPATVADLAEAIQQFEGYEGKTGEFKAVARVKTMAAEGLVQIEGKKVTPTYELGDSPVPVSGEAVVEANAKSADPQPIVAQKGLGFLQDVDLKELWKKTQHGFVKYLTTRGYLPKDVFDKWNTTRAEIKKYEAQVQFTVSDLRTAIAEEYKKVSKVDVVDMNLYLQGQATITVIPPKTARILDVMRAQVDNLSGRIVREMNIAGDLGIKINDNMGIYLNRSYRKYDDPKWNAPEQIKNKAMAFIRSKYPKYSDAEVAGLMNYLMTDAESPMAIIAGGGIDKINLSALRKRGDIAPEIRALMGEYDDPIANYARSIAKMAQMVAKNHFQQDVKRDGIGVYMFEQPTGEHTVKIEAGKTSAFKTVDGKPLYATKEVAAVLAEYDKQQPLPSWLKWSLKQLAKINLGLTVLSPTTHSRNFFANTYFALSNGHYRLNKIPKVFTAIQGVGKVPKGVAGVLGIDNAQARMKWLEYTQLGIVGDGVSIGLINDYISDIKEGMDISSAEPIISKKGAKSLGKKALDKTERVYHLGDNVYKIFAYENEVERYTKAYPNWSKEQVQVQAAENVKNTYPTYSRVPKAVKMVKTIPFVGGFISFPSEVVRTTYNTAELAIKEMRSGNPELFKVGVTRMAGLITALGLPTAMSYGSMALLSMDGDDDDDVKNFVAPYQQNNELIYLQKEGAKYTYMDFGPFDPHAMLKKPVYAFFRGEDLTDAGLDAFKEAIAPFTTEQVGSSAAIDIYRNQTAMGRPIFDENSPFGDRQVQKLTYVYNKIAPGILKTVPKVYDAAKGEVNQYGEEYRLSNEFLAIYPGVRVKTLDIDAAAPFKVSEFNRAFDNATLFFNKNAKFRQNATEEEIVEAEDAYIESVTTIYIRAMKTFDSAIRLGAYADAFATLDVPNAYVDWDRVEKAIAEEEAIEQP